MEARQYGKGEEGGREGDLCRLGRPGKDCSEDGTSVRRGPQALQQLYREAPAAGCSTGSLSAIIVGNWTRKLVNIMDMAMNGHGKGHSKTWKEDTQEKKQF